MSTEEAVTTLAAGSIAESVVNKIGLAASAAVISLGLVWGVHVGTNKIAAANCFNSANQIETPNGSEVQITYRPVRSGATCKIEVTEP